jgi:peptide/nickel transport system substrate-binding protein
MIKNFRERIWFVTGFFKKYSLQIFISLGVTVLFAFLGSFIIGKLPQPKPVYKIGIIGQFGTSQLPQYIINFLSAGLVSLNDQLEPNPGLAERWEVEDNGTTYTFYLRPGLRWRNGTFVKASDIKISIPNIAIETKDPNIIRFRIPTKFSPFPTLLNIPLLNQNGETATDYDIRLKQKSSGVISQISIDSPQKKFIFNVFSTPKLALTSFKLGQQDLIYELPAQYHDESVSFGKITKQVDYNHVVLLIFNQTDPNLKEKGIRQGIAYSLQDKTFGEVEALTTINPRSWAFNPLVKTYPFNPQRTRDLIKAPITLELSTTPELLSVAEEIKKELDSDLIKINTKVITSTPDQFQLLLTNYNIPADPDQYRDWHSTQATNIGRGSDEKIDKLLEDGRVTLDAKARKQIYFDFQKTFSEELPAVVLYHPSTINLARKEAYFDILKDFN